MIEIIPYAPQYKMLWDEAVAESRNGLFQHRRDYMDYHAQRFATVRCSPPMRGDV